MKRTIVTVIAIGVAALGLTACGTSSDPAPSASATVTVTVPATQAPVAAASPAPTPVAVDPAVLRAQLISAGDDWVMGQLAMMSVHNPKLSAVMAGGVTVGDPKDNAFKVWSEAGPTLDAALADEAANGTPDADLVAVMQASFDQWDLIMADKLATDDEMKGYVHTVNNPWKALGGLA